MVTACGIGCQIYRINIRYPGPEVWTGGLQDSVREGNYTFAFTGWQWGDGSLLHELCPGFVLLMDEDGKEYPARQERVGLITLTITKHEDDDSILDLTAIAFESGAWGNQFDMELMYLLNPELKGLRLQMEKGECREIVFPMTMLDQQFREEAWSHIDDRSFYIVLDYYPQKLQFCCGDDKPQTP